MSGATYNVALDELSTWDEGTIVAALLYYGINEKSAAEHCVAALRALGHARPAETLSVSTDRTPPPHSVKV